jgi:hypothetical protein
LQLIKKYVSLCNNKGKNKNLKKTQNMKTTTKIIAAKKLAKSTVSKSSIAYQVAFDIVNNTNKSYKLKNNTIRPVHTSGLGRFTSNLDYTKDIQLLLSSIGIDTVLTNDSPRGGLTGNLLTITTKLK